MTGTAQVEDVRLLSLPEHDVGTVRQHTIKVTGTTQVEDVRLLSLPEVDVGKVRQHTHQGDRDSTGGRCEAAVTARTRCGNSKSAYTST